MSIDVKVLPTVALYSLAAIVAAVGISHVVTTISLKTSAKKKKDTNSSKTSSSPSSFPPWPPNGISFEEYIYISKELQWIHYQEEWVNKYGPIFHIKSPFPLLIPEQVVVADPKIAKELWVIQSNQYKQPYSFSPRPSFIGKAIEEGEGKSVTALTGSEWKWRRNALLKEFHTSRLRDPDRQLLLVVFDNVATLCDKVHNAAISEQPIEVDLETTKLAVNVIFYFLFGRRDIKFDPNAFRQAGNTMVQFVTFQLFHPWHNIMKYIPGTECYNALKEKDNAWNVIDSTIEKEINTLCKEYRNEIEIHPNRQPGCAISSLLEKEPKFRMDIDKLVPEARVFTLAGFETTAHSIAFAIGLLAEYPNIATQIAKEGREAGLYSDKEIVSTTKMDLRKILDSCPSALYFFQEALRLFPPLPISGGQCVQDCIVTDSNGNTYGLPKGTGVSLYTMAMHRRFCEKGDSVILDRWNNELSTPPNFHTFSSGPHVCVGKNLALLEGHVAVLMLATNYLFEFVDGQTKVELDPCNSTVFSVPKDGMRLLVSKRQW